MDVYRSSSNKNKTEVNRAMVRFRRAVEFTIHSPFIEEFAIRSKEAHMMVRGLLHLAERFIEVSMQIEKKQANSDQ